MWHYAAALLLAVQVHLTPSVHEITPGTEFSVDVEITIPDGWHIYYKEPGDTGKPTDIQFVLPDGFSVKEMRWPQPIAFDDNGFHTKGYVRKVVITAVIQAPQEVATNEASTRRGGAPAPPVVELTAKVSWLACKDSCEPGTTTVTTKLSVADASSNGFGDVIYYVALAFVGGMLLNLMPCVLPVVSLKILSFAKQAGQDSAQTLRLGLAYCAGTVSSFLALAAFVIAARELGFSIGWGFQFQHPLFLLGMSALLLVMSLGLFELFHISISTGQEALGKMAGQKGRKGAFASGVLATLLSTPCTAPFLAVALGFAFSQPWWSIALIFGAAGSGLAAPYLVLSWNAKWLTWLPKPGMWMVYFKELMAFPMLLTAVWMLSVLLRQTGAVFETLTILLSVGFSAWLVGRFADFNATRRRKVIVWCVVALLLGLVGFTMIPTALHPAAADPAQATTATTGGAERYSEQALQAHLQAGEVVLVDFTADWCLTCKVYEKTVLSSSEVQQALRANGVVVLRADWTNGDPVVTAKLKEFQRAGVPLYVVYSPHRPNQPIVLPDLITARAVIEAIEKAAKP